MIDAQLMITAGEREDLRQRPSIVAALTYITREPMTVFGCCVARQRSQLACEALRTTDADVFVSIDPDVWFEQWQLDAVVARARETRGICGGLYSHAEALYNFAANGAHTLPAGENRTEVFRVGPRSPQGPTQADAIGTGFLAAHRSVYERIPDVHPELILSNQSSSAHWYYERMLPAEHGMHCLTEDYGFCSYARDAGVPVEILPNIVLGHRSQPWWHPLGREPEFGYATLKITSHGFCRPDAHLARLSTPAQVTATASTGRSLSHS